MCWGHPKIQTKKSELEQTRSDRSGTLAAFPSFAVSPSDCLRSTEPLQTACRGRFGPKPALLKAPHPLSRGCLRRFLACLGTERGGASSGLFAASSGALGGWKVVVTRCRNSSSWTGGRTTRQACVTPVLQKASTERTMPGRRCKHVHAA